MYSEDFKNEALLRTGYARVNQSFAAPKPSAQDVARSNDVPAPIIRKNPDLKRAKAKAIWLMFFMSVGVSLLLVLASRAKIVKL